MQDNVESPKEPITIGSEDGAEPPSAPEDMLESDGSWQEASTEEDPKQEVKTTFIRFRKKSQHPKGPRSNGWCLVYGGTVKGWEPTAPTSKHHVYIHKTPCLQPQNLFKGILW